MRRWAFWVIELPAAIVTGWLWLYRLFLLVASIALWGIVMVMLVLYWGFGVRWGW